MGGIIRSFGPALQPGLGCQRLWCDDGDFVSWSVPIVADCRIAPYLPHVQIVVTGIFLQFGKVYSTEKIILTDTG
jgi:hypothetical protein